MFSVYGEISKERYSRILEVGYFGTSALWDMIFMFTLLWIAQHMTQFERSMVGLCEAICAVIMLTVLLKKRWLAFVTDHIMRFQIIDAIISICTRFMVIWFPVAYSIICALRSGVVATSVITASHDLENLIFSDHERTNLISKIWRAQKLGSVFGAGIAVICADISIYGTCTIWLIGTIITYSYEIWLIAYLKKLVAKETNHIKN